MRYSHSLAPLPDPSFNRKSVDHWAFRKTGPLPNQLASLTCALAFPVIFDSRTSLTKDIKLHPSSVTRSNLETIPTSIRRMLCGSRQDLSLRRSASGQ